MTFLNLIHLLENDVLSFENVAKFVDDLICGFGDDAYIDPGLSEIVACLLDKDYEIRAEWVAALVHYVELIESHKLFHNPNID